VRLALHGHATSCPITWGLFWSSATPVCDSPGWSRDTHCAVDLTAELRDRPQGYRSRPAPRGLPFTSICPRSIPHSSICARRLSGCGAEERFFPRGERGTLYLWLGGPPERATRLGGTLVVHAGRTCRFPPWLRSRAYPPAAVLDGDPRLLPGRQRRGHSVRGDAGATLELLPTAARRLSLGANAIRSRPGILMDERRNPRARRSACSRKRALSPRRCSLA